MYTKPCPTQESQFQHDFELVELSPMSDDVEESELEDAISSDSDVFETPQKRDLSYSPTPEVDEELPNEMDIDDDLFVDPKDLDNSFVPLPESSKQGNPVNQKKFIVFESCLDQLLMSSRCKRGCTGSIVKIQKYRVGSALCVMGFCSKGHKFHLWKSQPSIGKMPVGNLLLSAGVLFSGSNFVNVEAMFDFIVLYGISKTTHNDNQQKYLFL